MLREKTNSYKPGIFLTALLLLAFMNFQLIGVYLLIFAAVIIIIKNKVTFSRRAVLPLVFSFIYFIFVIFQPDASFVSASKIFVVPLVFIMGYSITKKYPNVNSILAITIILALGMASHGLLNFWYNIQIGAVFSYGETADFWSGKLSSSTGQAINFSLFIAISYWMLFIQKNRILKVISFFTLIIATIYDILIGGRTYLGLLFITFALYVLFQIYFSIREKSFLKRTFPIILIIAVIFVAIVIIYNNNIFGINDMFKSSYFYTRFFSNNAYENIGETSRWKRKRIYLQNMPIYPFGGNHIKEGLKIGSAHELWLDVFDDAGIFAFSILWIYTIALLCRYLFMMADKSIKWEQRLLFFLLPIIMMVQFFLEPILSGAPLLLYAYIIIDGMNAAYIDQRRRGII